MVLFMLALSLYNVFIVYSDTENYYCTELENIVVSKATSQRSQGKMEI